MGQGTNVYLTFENTHHLEAVRAAVDVDKIFGRFVKATDTPVHDRAKRDKGGGSNTSKGKKGKSKSSKWGEQEEVGRGSDKTRGGERSSGKGERSSNRDRADPSSSSRAISNRASAVQHTEAPTENAYDRFSAGFEGEHRACYGGGASSRRRGAAGSTSTRGEHHSTQHGKWGSRGNSSTSHDSPYHQPRTSTHGGQHGTHQQQHSGAEHQRTEGRPPADDSQQLSGKITAPRRAEGVVLTPGNSSACQSLLNQLQLQGVLAAVDPMTIQNRGAELHGLLQRQATQRGSCSAAASSSPGQLTTVQILPQDDPRHVAGAVMTALQQQQALVQQQHAGFSQQQQQQLRPQLLLGESGTAVVVQQQSQLGPVGMVQQPCQHNVVQQSLFPGGGMQQQQHYLLPQNTSSTDQDHAAPASTTPMHQHLVVDLRQSQQLLAQQQQTQLSAATPQQQLAQQQQSLHLISGGQFLSSQQQNLSPGNNIQSPTPNMAAPITHGDPAAQRTALGDIPWSRLQPNGVDQMLGVGQHNLTQIRTLYEASTGYAYNTGYDFTPSHDPSNFREEEEEGGAEVARGSPQSEKGAAGTARRVHQ